MHPINPLPPKHLAAPTGYFELSVKRGKSRTGTPCYSSISTLTTPSPAPSCYTPIGTPIAFTVQKTSRSASALFSPFTNTCPLSPALPKNQISKHLKSDTASEEVREIVSPKTAVRLGPSDETDEADPEMLEIEQQCNLAEATTSLNAARVERVRSVSALLKNLTKPDNPS